MQKHKVHKLFVFGSILTNRFNDKSDVDLVVDFNKKKQKITLITTLILNTLWRNYWAEKQTYWKNKPSKSIFEKNVDATKTLIYG